MRHGYARHDHSHMTKSRNRKLIRVTSFNERLERQCVDLSDYNRWRAQTKSGL